MALKHTDTIEGRRRKLRRPLKPKDTWVSTYSERASMPAKHNDTQDTIRAQALLDGDCWLWQGRKRQAFGQQIECVATLGGRQQLAQRVAYQLWHGPIPAGAMIRTTCKRTNECVNPEHLYAGPPLVKSKR